MGKKLFVALGHNLSDAEVASFNGEIVSLSDGSSSNPFGYWAASWATGEMVDALGRDGALWQPVLGAQMGEFPSELRGIKDLARRIVIEAVVAGATHFYISGEPTLCMWANLYAAGRVPVQYNSRGASAGADMGELMCHGFIGANGNWPGQLDGRLICIRPVTELVNFDTPNRDGTLVGGYFPRHSQWLDVF